MQPLIWRELALVWRARAFWVATIGYVLLLLLFVIVWGDGLPIANSGTNWQQFNAVQWGILTVLLPWTAARCATLPRRNLIMLSLATAAPPSRLLLARGLAVAAALLALILVALPVVLLMQQIAAAPVGAIATSLIVCAGLAAFAAAAANFSMAMTDNPLIGWTGATLVTLMASLVIPSGATLLWLLASACITVALLLVADSRLRYLPEELAA